MGHGSFKLKIVQLQRQGKTLFPDQGVSAFSYYFSVLFTRGNILFN
jgi:hypothetical protein